MTCIRCNHSTAKRFGTYGKRRVQRWRCNSCQATFADPATPKPLGGNSLLVSQLAFDPKAAIGRTYGDLRAFGGPTVQALEAGAPRFALALVFLFRDTSLKLPMLFEQLLP